MIYLDNAATTKMYKEAIDAMKPYYDDIYGNPSEIYNYASQSRKAMNDSRKILAEIINAEPAEIYFTSGGTESDNWALIGAAETYENKGKHIITTAFEHHAVINTCKYLEKRGFEITYINPDYNGIINVGDIKKAIRQDTILISVMMANNEVGTIQPIYEIGRLAKENNILFHTDAVQAFAQIPIDVKAMNIDMLSASAHKCHGPKGVGLLYIRNGIKLDSFHHGGKQERMKRAGTENIPGIIGFSRAAKISSERMEYNSIYLTNLRNHFIERVLNEIDYVKLSGDSNMRLPGNAHFCFEYIDGEAIQIQLDLKQICCSTGSACNAGESVVSHVLTAMKIPFELAKGSVRFTISEDNTVDEIDETVNYLVETVNKLRKMSNEYKMVKAE